MLWFNKKNKLPYCKNEFVQILVGFVVLCPSSIKQRIRINKGKGGKRQYMYAYNAVSVRDCSFRSRGISGSLLTTILAQIRRPLVNNGTYAVVKSKEQVEKQVEKICNSTTLSDENFELVVFKKHTNMSETESIYYYIRNAFAHGSFEIIGSGNKTVYKLESSKNGNINAQMRLKGKTLKSYIQLANKTPAEIKALQKPKKNQKK